MAKRVAKKKVVSKQKKQYVGISRDHSGSMRSLSSVAMKDYNTNIQAINSAATSNKLKTAVSVVRCGINDGVQRELVNVDSKNITQLYSYPTDGQTPLFDSVGELIDIFEAAPDVNDPNVTFLIMAITDGQENYSKTWNASEISSAIKRLQATDRWTFVFRVPFGYAKPLAALGIPKGNIQEWEQTEEGMRIATAATVDAVQVYMGGTSRGITSSSTFYADLGSVKPKDVKAVMTNISQEVIIWPVKNGGDEIKVFVEKKLRKQMHVGSAFYQLTKPERKVQEYKMIVIRDKRTGGVYAGQSARDLLQLPSNETIRLAPGDHGNYDIYIQSTSLNRKLIAGTNLLYWAAAKNARFAAA